MANKDKKIEKQKIDPRARIMVQAKYCVDEKLIFGINPLKSANYLRDKVAELATKGWEDFKLTLNVDYPSSEILIEARRPETDGEYKVRMKEFNKTVQRAKVKQSKERELYEKLKKKFENGDRQI